MIIIPKKINDSLLQLLAYSYKDTEINVLDFLLKELKIEPFISLLAPDVHSRKGKMFEINKQDHINQFEIALGIKFLIRNEKTFVQIDKSKIQGENYRCIRISHVAWESGCQNITAENDSAAFVKCSLIANENNWFGSEYEKGSC